MNFNDPSQSTRPSSPDYERAFGPTHFGLVTTHREVRPLQGLTLVVIGALAIAVGIVGLLRAVSQSHDDQ